MSNDYNTILVNQDEFTIDDAMTAAKQLFEVQVDDFYALKNEKWYKHLLNAITLGSDKKKKTIKNIRSLSKLQTIFMKVYCENYKGLDSQLNKVIEDLYKTNETVKKLYINCIVGVHSQQSILDLSQLEQDILLLILCAYTSNYGNEEGLKKYRACIAQTIGRGLPQGEFKPELLEQVNAGDLFYRFIIEMCAIDGGLDDFAMPDIIQESINYLTISNRTKETVENQIRSELNNFGVEYLENKYGVAEDDLLEDDFEIEDENFIDEEFSTIIIDEEVTIVKDSSLVYKNKEIFVHANIICDGELLFDNCKIVYNDKALASCIKISESGQLTINDSTIKCLSLKMDYFFKCQGNIILKNSKLIDCAYLFTTERDLSVSGCEIINCVSSVFNIETYKSTKVSINNNTISQSGLQQFYCDILPKRTLTNALTNGLTNVLTEAMIEVSSYNHEPSTNYQFNNNVINELDGFGSIFKNAGFKFFYLKADVMEITQSSFFNTTSSISAKKISECYFLGCKNVININSVMNRDTIRVDNCIFEKCEDVIDCTSDFKVINCQFVSCKNKLINAESAILGGVIVDNCIFKNITNDFDDEDTSLTSWYLHLGGAARNSALYFNRCKGLDSKENKVCNCIFDGISMKKAFLIASDGWEKPKDDVTVTVSKCTFSHCETKRKSKKLIKEYFSYTNAFKKEKEVKATIINQCMGIESFNTEGGMTSDLSIKLTSESGRKIGADNSMIDH